MPKLLVCPTFYFASVTKLTLLFSSPILITEETYEMDIFRRPLALFCRIFVKSLHKTNFRRLAYHDDGTSTSDSFFCRSVLSKYILHKVEKNQFSPTCLSRRQPGLGLFLAMFCPQLVTSNHLEFDLARHDSNLAMKSGKTSCKIISFSLLRYRTQSFCFSTGQQTSKHACP